MFWDSFIAAFFGLGLHFSMKWFDARQSSTTPPGFVTYVKAVPAQTAVSLFAAAGVFWVAYTMDWLNPGMGFACGYMGNSIADNVAKRFVPTQ